MLTGQKKEYKKISIETLKDSFRIFFRFNRYLIRYWRAEFLMLIAGSISMALSLLGPYLGKIVLDNGILARDMRLFFKFSIIAGMVYLLRQFSDRIGSWIRDMVARRLRVKLARDVLKKVSRLSISSFQDASVGECVSRIGVDVSASANMIANTFPDLIKSGLRLAAVTAIIFVIDARLMLVILGYQFVVIAQIYFFTKKNEELAIASQKNNWEMSRALTQIFSQIYFVKISGNISSVVRKYFRTFADSVRQDEKNKRLEAVSDILSEASGKLFFGVIGFVGTLFVIRGGLTLGSLGAAIAYMSQGSGAYTALFGLLQKVVLNRFALERTAEILDEPVQIEESARARSVKFSEGRVDFKDVIFGYDDSRYILNKMNFSVLPKSKIALVGPSGCGKTTIANLILRLYDVNSGKILLEGCDVKDIKFRSIYGQIGLVPQSPFIWNGSIREIITYYGSKIDDLAMIEAAKLAEIHLFIAGLPAGYDTVLSDIVSKISQGQKQRIALARAIAKRPKILIMDEACSSLDSNTEERIIDNIRHRYPRMTFIMISHRLSAVRKMDAVYFFKGPGEMSVGSHAGLADNDIKYMELFATQLAGKNRDRVDSSF